jgi:serine/threonine protein kinase
MQGDPFGWVGHTVAGKFRVDALVAEGGFGVVYRALHVGFNALVALKCLKLPARLQGADRDRFLDAFLAEGRLLHQLSRSTAGIVQALDVGAAVSPSGAWTPYLALEWLDGRPLDVDLAERARRRMPGRSLAEAVALLDSAAQALALAHEQGVAHRDLKPGNLFVAEVGGKRVCKVVDFGIAKVVADVSNVTRALQETGAAIQAFTPLYGAPEQFDRKYGATGPWTDVFAFALVLVEMMTGQPALDGADTTQLFVSSMRPDRRPTPRACGVPVSDAIEQIFARALAVDPRARFRALGPLWQALTAEVARSPVPMALAATAYGPTSPAHPSVALAPTAFAPTALAPTVNGPSTTAPQMASFPPRAGAGAVAQTAPERAPRVWIGVVAGAGALVVVAAVVVAVLALRVASTQSTASPGGTGAVGGGGGGSSATLRASAAQKLLRKDPTCLADFDAADRVDPAGMPPTLEPARAFCEMVAGKCEQGRKRYREYILANTPTIQGDGVEAAVNAVAAQYCPRDQLNAGERTFALAKDVNAAWQKGDTKECIVLGNELLASLDSLPDRTGAQQTVRMQAASALGTAAQCAAKGGRCDEAHAFFRARIHAVTKQQATDAQFRSAHPECAGK